MSRHFRTGVLVAAHLTLASGSMGAQAQTTTAGGPASPDPAAQVVARGAGYADVIRLQHQRNPADDGRLLLTFEQPDAAGLPLYESDTGGRTWTRMGQVVDQAHGGDPAWRLRWQPNLLEAPRASGDIASGDILLAANATHGERVDAERLQLYVSHDAGRSWRYLSDIVDGGGRPEDRDNRGVWEPNLCILPDGRLVAYYSSEQHKDEGFNQLLAHKVSRDGGRTWGPEVIDVAAPGEVERPGMAVVAALPDGRFVMSYEDIDGPNNGQVHLKFSRDGLNWGAPSDPGRPVATAAGAWPAASPIVTWLHTGSPKGVLAVVAERARGSGADEGGRTVFWNDELGEGPWWQARLPVQKLTGNIHAGWTQALLPTQGGLLHVTSSSVPEAPKNADRNLILSAIAPVDFRRYEAEDAERTGGVFIDAPKTSGTGMVRLSNLPGSQVRFQVNSDLAGRRVLVMRVADVDRATRPRLTVNGTEYPLDDEAPPAAAPGWRIERADVALKAARNTIAVSPGAHALDLDYIELDPQG